MIFGNSDDIPRDVVPQPGLTLEVILRADAAVGRPGTGSIPGEIIVDPDGMPLGVEESRKVTSIVGPMVLLQSDVDRLAIDPTEHPGIVVMPDPPKRSHDDQ